ncbi:MAG: amidohydrolase family protein, partial [Acidobacteria bacterium]|nr:amidohydrolase family protein [Acidobacteriota bacterium]
MSLSALRGRVVTCLDDPFRVDAGALSYEPDGLVVYDAGRITATGPAHVLLPTLPANTPVAHFPNHLISPGFIDTHVHYTQTAMVGAHGAQLLDWLNRYAFPTELRFSD